MDWSKIIQDLQQTGLTQNEIAKYCNCSQGLISQIKNKQVTAKRSRKTLSFEIGDALLKLYSEVINK